MDPHPLPRDSLKRKLDTANDANHRSPSSSPTSPPKRLRLALPPSSSSSSSSSSAPPARPQAPHYALRGPAPPVVHTPSPVSPLLPNPSIPLFPPITRETLRELDLEAILRNPQLRHDLLFDPNLQFRPTAGRRKQALADCYWGALFQELSTGPTHRPPRPTTPPPWSPHYPPRAEREFPMRERVLTMLVELRCLLAAVLVPAPVPVTAPAPAPAPPPSDDAAALLAHIHPALIAQELSRGIFDPAGLFRLMADVLKRHCAPMRDHLVDDMLRVASSPTPAPAIRTLKALRLAFSLLELMKLDIANHQLHHLRPFLARSSPDFELRTFLAEASPASVLRSRRWLRPFLPSPPLSRPQVHRALIHALTCLIFPDPTTPAPAPATFALDLPRLTLLRRDAADLSALYLLLMLARTLAPPPSSRTTAAPTSAADVDRLKRAIWAVGPRRIGTCFYQEPRLHGQGDVPVAEAEQDWEGVILQIALAALPGSSTSPPPQTPTSSSPADSTHDTPPTADPTHSTPLPAPHTLALLRGWVHTHMRPASPLAVRLRAILRDAVCARCVRADPALAVTMNPMPTPAVNMDPAVDLHPAPTLAIHPTPPPPPPPTQSLGLEPLVPELAHLAARVAKLAHVHVAVYWSLYAAGKEADDAEGEEGEEENREREEEREEEDGGEENNV